jgi:hypothetical protein
MFVVVAIFGAVTVILGTLLIVLIAPSLLVGLGVSFVSFSTLGLVIFLGLRQHRTEPLLSSGGLKGAVFTTLAESELKVPLAESIGSLRYPWLLALSSSMAIPLVASGLVFLEQGYSETLWNILLWINLGAPLVVTPALLITSANRRQAANLAGASGSRFLLANADGLQVPLELLTEPALNFAVQQGKAQVFVPWDAITHWHVSETSGRQSKMHILTVDAAKNSYGGLFGRFAIRRSPELLRVEHTLLALARKYSRCLFVSSVGKAPLN